MSLVFNIIILLGIILFSINRLNNNYKLFYLLLYIYYQGIITSASLTFIETSIHISEQGRQSYFVGANFVFLFFFLVSIFTLEFAIKLFDSKFQVNIPWFSLNSKKIEFSIIYYLSILILSLLLLNLIISDSPILSSNVTRFTFWRNSKLSFLQSVFGNTATFLPFMFGIVYMRKRRKAIILLLVYVIYLVFIGQKFSPIVRAFYVFFIPFVLHSNFQFKFNIFRIIKSYFTLIFIILFGIVYIKYSIDNPFRYYGIKTPSEAIFYRAFGLQGHLFWGCVEQFVYVGKTKSWDITELYKGMHVLMRYFWYGDLAHIEKSMENGFSFANAYPAILLKIFPLGIAYFFHAILVTFLFTPIIWLFKISVAKKRLLFALVVFQFFNWMGISFIMGYFNKAVPGVIFIILLSLYSFLIVESKKLKA